MPDRLTKTDTVALRHAVDALAWQVRTLAGVEPRLTPEQEQSERDRLAAARRALRKVNALRRSHA